LAKGKGPNADYVPVGARVIVKKMFLMEGSNVGRGTNGYECSEHDIEHGDCLMIDADHILAVCDDD
jgi:pSer/pThr/pTyr-binding forkhead associated (FHA) protein